MRGAVLSIWQVLFHSSTPHTGACTRVSRGACSSAELVQEAWISNEHQVILMLRSRDYTVSSKILGDSFSVEDLTVNHFQLCRPYNLCCNYSTLLL